MRACDFGCGYFFGRDPREQSSVMGAEAPMQRVGRQARELRTAQMKKRLMVAGLHIDLGLRFDAVVDDDVEAVARADGGNRAVDAVAEQPIDLMFIGHVDPVAELGSQFR